MREREITDEEALNLLRSRISFSYRQKDMARDLGISAAMLSSVLNGHKAPTAGILASVGVRKVQRTHYYLREAP